MQPRGRAAQVLSAYILNPNLYRLPRLDLNTGSNDNGTTSMDIWRVRKATGVYPAVLVIADTESIVVVVIFVTIADAPHTF